MILEYEDETGPLHWSTERFDRVIALREEALQAARLAWADYLFVSLKPCSMFNRAKERDLGNIPSDHMVHFYTYLLQYMVHW